MRTDFKTAAFWALAALLAAIPFSNALFEIASCAFIGFFLLSLFQKKDFIFFRQTFFTLILIYFLMNLLSFARTEYPDASVRGLLKVLKNILLCAGAAYVIDSEKRFRAVFWTILIAAVFAGLDAWIQGMRGVDLLGRHPTAFYGTVGRLTGPFRHANDFAAYLSVVFFLFLAAVTDGFAVFSRRKYLFCLAGSILTAGCLVVTYSRGAWIAVAVVFLISACVKRNRITAAFLAAGVVFVLFFSPPLVKQRLGRLFEPGRDTLVERKALWGESIQMIRTSPLIGLGVNTYARNEMKFKTSHTDFQYAHNGYLQMAAEIGLFGLFSFLAVVVYFLTKCPRAAARSPGPYVQMAGPGLAFAVAAFLLGSAADTSLHSLRLVNFFWILMGIGWSAKNV
ncbi:MAG: O-antigen ligase family protein [Candidatus Omnitrophica bacterium]|nr:O-antigen ligase family protein [Candidatus Omnitrophota bacterium]